MDFVINAKMLVRIYVGCLKRTLKLSRKHWWVLFTVFAYVVILRTVVILSAPLGFIGGLIISITIDACLSSFLVMVENMVRDQKFSFNDFKKSFWVYFFDVMGVIFVIWILFLVLGMLRVDYRIIPAVKVILFIFLNPMPELIYYAHHGTMELMGRSYNFIKANWPEWFIPNLIVGYALYRLLQIPWPLPELIHDSAKMVFFAFATYFFMIFRGLLFQALYRSSRRMRLFQYRAEGE